MSPIFQIIPYFRSRAVTAAGLMLASVAAFSAGEDPVITAKPSAPIAIDYELSSVPAVGQPLRLKLTVSAEVDLDSFGLSLAAADPLAVIDPLGKVPHGPLAAREVAEIPVIVLPFREETHYLNVTVEAVIAGVVQTRSIAVPVRLDGAGLRKAEDTSAGANGETVRSLRAVETVR